MKDHVVFDYDPKGKFRVFSQVPGKQGRCVKQTDHEKPSGEWNTVELVCYGENSIHIVNGKVVMRLHAPRRIDGTKPVPVTSGPLILQSEGAEIFYRDIEYVPITSIPPECAEPSFRTLSVGATPESVVEGFDGKLYVTLMGAKREKGDGDGGIVRIDGDKATVFTAGLDEEPAVDCPGLESGAAGLHSPAVEARHPLFSSERTRHLPTVGLPSCFASSSISGTPANLPASLAAALSSLGVV